MTATLDSPQVWLNFDVVRSRRIRIIARVRFIEARHDADLKLILLSDRSGDYSLQLRPDGQRILIQHAKGAVETVLSEYKLPAEIGSQWFDVEFRLFDDRLTAVVDGVEVMEASNGATERFYPCIAALNCVAELIEPFATVEF